MLKDIFKLKDTYLNIIIKKVIIIKGFYINIISKIRLNSISI
jgi:hypothetical protein